MTLIGEVFTKFLEIFVFLPLASLGNLLVRVTVVFWPRSGSQRRLNSSIKSCFSQLWFGFIVSMDFIRHSIEDTHDK